jgi:hypothetical protein
MSRRDPVTPDVAEYVKLRDGACVLSLMETMHRCRNQWGDPIAAFDLGAMTLEHVKSELRMGKRAPSDPAHLVTLCGYANVNVPTKAQRELMRRYLAAREAA